ncbi:MAG TPA: arginine--tRNA ligase, partial [Candidatus Eisenbacteria bacterium]|nr:arginine--tRNA ligase [Candidatus Eisenbacteria bacterium]
SIIFKGEQYGLHTRVFVTQKGNPTYEGKEIALGFAEYEAFPFDMKIHVVASEQAGYFQVVFKALEQMDPEKFEGHEYHLSMGMVQLVGRKMSSRTGDVLTVDELLDKVKEAAGEQFKEEKEVADRDKVLEQIVIGAVKYAILKGGVRQDAKFDIETSVSLDGNSGPYIQYTYARTQSVVGKAQSTGLKPQLSQDYTVLEDEKKLMQKIAQFPEIVESAAENYAPNTICEYLFELAQLFNNFYQKYRILNANSDPEKEFRLALTQGVGVILRQGLYLLGIQAPEKM